MGLYVVKDPLRHEASPSWCGMQNEELVVPVYPVEEHATAGDVDLEPER